MTDTPTPDEGANQKPRPAPMGISVEMITAAYAALETPVPAAQLESILWLFRYAKSNKVPGNAALGKLLNPPLEQSSISKLFSASYGASLDGVCGRIEEFRAKVAQAAEVDGVPLVRLPWLTGEVSAFAEIVYKTRSIGFIWGRNQNGKTEAVKAHAAASKRRTIRVDMPDGAVKTEFLDNCLEAIGVSTNKANGEKKKTFAGYLNADTELIIDEFHQCWATGPMRVAVVEMIRRWRDLRGCSVLLVCTSLDALTDKRSLGVLDQTMNRGVMRLQIPTEPAREDVAAIMEGYRLRPPTPGSRAEEIVAAVCAESGLGKLCKYLQIARVLGVDVAKQGEEAFVKPTLATPATPDSYIAANSDPGVRRQAAAAENKLRSAAGIRLAKAITGDRQPVRARLESALAITDPTLRNAALRKFVADVPSLLGSINEDPEAAQATADAMSAALFNGLIERAVQTHGSPSEP